ncbi:GyrI-like domain-containing protein [Flavobacterium humi]|uniref:GyrI-like small molecule binding domain-containing protein n=1 Tax=Flavobacterium humi TaxID=2562683 RepID=A0A4Z0L6C0_9FLAO|nr:GyrI-like domain-containing protein [Flavobacterium humi]TGD56717.1 hypothetical protein E4635_14845 [Flavobacterium humi]
MEKLDLTKVHKTYYSAKSKPELMYSKEARFLSITGKGDPSQPEYAAKIQALYAVAYAVKFQNKAIGQDFVVPKLEGLWSFDLNKYTSFPIAEIPLQVPRSEWSYRMLIMMPDYVTAQQITQAVESVLEKKQLLLAKETGLFTMAEGKSVQVLHTGPFANEPETLQKILEFTKAHNLQQNGPHHEIYLSDFRKTPPEKLRTILREPVK